MKEVGYYNGTIGPLSEINCPILDRAVYFGDGCYDATYVQNGVIFALEDTRFLHCNIKTLNLIPSVIANQKAKEAGCQEVIFHRGDRVTEMAHSNVSFLVDGTLVYHPFDNKVLPGIAIKHLIKTAEKLGVPTRAEEITVTEAMNADELIITSSGTLCNRITEVDKIPVGGKADELFHKLQDAAWDEFMVYTKQK